MTSKVICAICKWIGDEKAVDKVNDPKSTSIWRVCPDCRTPEHLVPACDEPGCTREATSGFPTPNGYRQTCGDHYQAEWRENKTSARN